ncbi:ketosteroid isomerase-like protein [Novosphingobium kunmingense]|uniref:Ketosteroid isomerase-like protein n=2 Tax=Novosphingobium kunmingense TaxID=1211806 RepID=A0A2N0H3A1_9SPHN|nr:ketosteroid isomerase-like protein [Novosphingobium kunmingense]
MTQDDDAIRAMAKRFFDAIEQGDIATMGACFALGAEIWHNTDELTVTVEQTKATLAGMVERIRERSYAERRLQVFPGGFVQQHALEGVRVHDGEKVRLPCCIVCQVNGNLITRLDEYFDSAHVATFRKFASA